MVVGGGGGGGREFHVELVGDLPTFGVSIFGKF